MLRLRSLLLCALLLGLFALLAHGQAAGEGALGAACENDESCQTGLRCAADVCLEPAMLDEDGNGPEGMGNECSEIDCCQTGLVCWRNSPNKPRCLPAADGQEVIECRRVDEGDEGIAEGQFCGNGDRCAHGLMCFRNECRDPPGDGEQYPNGWGNTCNAVDCCARGQACVQDACVPEEVGIAGRVECETEQPDSVDLDEGDNGAAAMSVPMMMLAALAAAAHMVQAM